MRKIITIIFILMLSTKSALSAKLEGNTLYLSLNESVGFNTSLTDKNGNILDNEPNNAFLSENEEIAIVDEYGNVYAQGKEGATIIYIGVNGVETSVKVIVSDNPENFDSDFYIAEKFLRDGEIMVGDEFGNFNPDKAMTRAEFSKIICKFTDNEIQYKGYGCDYTDVSSDFWGYNYVMSATQAGLLQGYGNNIFGRDDSLTEEQAVIVLCRMLGDTFSDVTYTETSNNEQTGFSEGYIAIAGEKIMDISALQKKVPATRARVAKWLYQLYCIKNNF